MNEETIAAINTLEALKTRYDEEILRLKRDKIYLKDEIGTLKCTINQMDEIYKKDRGCLEWLVWECLKDPFISFDRGRELLGFQHTEDFRDWFDTYEEGRV